MFFLSLYVFMSLCQKHNILSFLLFTLKNMHFLPSVFFVFMSFCLKNNYVILSKKHYLCSYNGCFHLEVLV